MQPFAKRVAVVAAVRNQSVRLLSRSAALPSRHADRVQRGIDERHFRWHHDVISTAEREAAYVIDGLMHNEVIKSDIHSTDSHGYSEIIFGTLHLLGFSFAPRIKDLKRQQLYAFRKRREYEQQGYELLPDGYIKMPLIEGLEFQSNGFEYLRDWALPHFYFHLVTAYDILRHNGVEIGKRDYLAHTGGHIRPVSG